MASDEEKNSEYQVNESVRRLVERSKFKSLEEAVNSALQKIINSTKDADKEDEGE